MWNFCQSRENMKNWAFAGNLFFTRFSQFQLTSRHFKCSSNKSSSKTFAQTRNKFFLTTLQPEFFRPKCSFGYAGCKYDDKSQNFFGSTMKNIHNFSEFWTFSLKLFHCTWRLKNSEDQPKFIRSVFKKGWFSWNPQMIFLPCFPGSETCWQKIPTRKVFPQNGEKHEYTKFLQKITLSAEFFSLIRSTVVMKSKYKMIFRNVSKGSEIFNISIEVCWKSSFWQLRIW